MNRSFKNSNFQKFNELMCKRFGSYKSYFDTRTNKWISRVTLTWWCPDADSQKLFIQLDMSSSVEIICEALDELLSLRDRVRDCAETSRKIAAFYLDAEKVSKWINKLGRPFLDKSTSIGKSQERATKLLERHAEFERVCQNTYSNVEKLLSTGHSLTTQFEQYHSFIGNKCQSLKGELLKLVENL